MPSAAQQILVSEITRRCGVPCELEYRFDEDRKWRLDIAWPTARVGVEVHGSVFTQGRHTRGKGFLADRSKMNAAQRAGFAVLEYSTGEISKDFGRVVDEVVDLIQARAK